MFSVSNNLFKQKEAGLHYRACVGIAYVNRPFSIKDNPYNTAFAQSIVASLQAGLVGKIQLRERTYLRLEAGLAHLSAGAFRLPNFGLNMPYVSLGLQQGLALDPRPVKKMQHCLPSLKRYSLWVLAAGGAKQAVNSYDPFSYCATLRAEGWLRFKNRSAVSLGVDAIYNEALAPQRKAMGLAATGPWRMGLSVGHEWLFATVAFSTQMGVYVFNKSPETQKAIYQRYGVRFNAGGKVAPSIFLRAHEGQADCVEIALTYKIIQQ
jgi:hypothetical protein